MNVDIIAWVVIALAALAGWHYVYEAILLPSFRQDVRYKLFAVRDRLRVFKAENPVQCSDETFHMLDDQLSWQMDNLPRLTFAYLYETLKLIRANSELRALVERRLAILTACQLSEYKEIRKDANELLTRVLMLNSGGLVVYLIPVAYLMVMWKRLKRWSQRFAVVPTSEIENLPGCPA